MSGSAGGGRISPLVAVLLNRLERAGLPRPELEHPVVAGRRWRADLAWPDRRVMAEVEGGVYAGGRHVRGIGYENDCRKYNAATLAGWAVYRFTRRLIEENEAVMILRVALEPDAPAAP